MDFEGIQQNHQKMLLFLQEINRTYTKGAFEISLGDWTHKYLEIQ